MILRKNSYVLYLQNSISFIHDNAHTPYIFIAEKIHRSFIDVFFYHRLALVSDEKKRKEFSPVSIEFLDSHTDRNAIMKSESIPQEPALCLSLS